MRSGAFGLEGILPLQLLPLSPRHQPGPGLDGRELGEGGHQCDRNLNHVHRLLQHHQDHCSGQNVGAEVGNKALKIILALLTKIP